MFLAKRLPALIATMTLLASVAEAEVDGSLAVAIGTPGSESFTFGTSLWAMGQIALLPEHGISLASREVTADEDRLSLLQNREVEAALVYGHVPNAYDDDVRAIMALWPQGVSSDDADPVQFLVHKDVAADVVYLITKAMFEHTQYFKNAHANLGIGLPSEAMTGLNIPLHAGAYRFYDENGFGLEETVTADYWNTKSPAVDTEETAGEVVETASTYTDFDDAALEPAEVEQIAAACRQALEVGSLSLVLGDLGNTGCEVYQERLTARTTDNTVTPEEAATSGQAELKGVYTDSLPEAPSGQGGPAIRWTPTEDQAGGAAWKPLPTRLARQPTM